MVRPTSRMPSAISLGVFWRSAPSTRRIMRSRKLCPGRAVILTVIWSDTTRVPPVTPERSLPDSRMTGADSPVIADSSIEAMPSITSPSPGTISPTETSTTSPSRSELDGTSWMAPPLSVSTLCAVVSAWVRRSDSARALPRPSATASAKLANSTVNHSQAQICPTTPVCSPAPPASCFSHNMVATSATTSVTKMTGLRHSVAGLSLTKASRLAAAARRPSSSLGLAVCDMSVLD